MQRKYCAKDHLDKNGTSGKIVPYRLSKVSNHKNGSVFFTSRCSARDMSASKLKSKHTGNLMNASLGRYGKCCAARLNKF